MVGGGALLDGVLRRQWERCVLARLIERLVAGRPLITAGTDHWIEPSLAGLTSQ
jgi:hypothetical protein